MLAIKEGKERREGIKCDELVDRQEVNDKRGTQEEQRLAEMLQIKMIQVETAKTERREGRTLR